MVLLIMKQLIEQLNIPELDKQIINNRLLYCNEIEDTLMKWEYINNISNEILNKSNLDLKNFR